MPVRKKKVLFFLKEKQLDREKKKQLAEPPFYHACHSGYQARSSKSLRRAEHGSYRKLKHSCFSPMSLCQDNRDQDDGIQTETSVVALALLFLCIRQLSSIHRWRTPAPVLNRISSLA